jgi:RHS repeat-associated protein
MFMPRGGSSLGACPTLWGRASINFGARYFSAAQGRFTSPDEPLVNSDPDNLQSWHLYSMGLEHPMLCSDADGHEPCVDGINPEN